MAKIIFQNMISVNGYFEGMNREIDWHVVDDEFNEYAAEMLNRLDYLVFGRRTYEIMAAYWPTGLAKENDPLVAEKMNMLPKIVASHTLERASWHNTRIVHDTIVQELTHLRRACDKDIAIFGSSQLALTLAKHNLIDEYHFLVAPVMLGSGHTVLEGLDQPLKLSLISTRVFKSGTILLSYCPAAIRDNAE